MDRRGYVINKSFRNYCIFRIFTCLCMFNNELDVLCAGMPVEKSTNQFVKNDSK